MAANDVNLLVYREDAAGVKQRETIQKLDATDCANLFDADALPGDKVDLANDVVAADVAAVSIPTTVGVPTIPIVLEVNVAAAGGAGSADVGTWTAPYACRIVHVSGVKTGANGGAGDLFEIEDAAGGAGNNIATLDLNENLSATTQSGVLTVTETDLAAGAVIHFRRTEATNAACRAVIWLIREA